MLRLPSRQRTLARAARPAGQDAAGDAGPAVRALPARLGPRLRGRRANGAVDVAGLPAGRGADRGGRLRAGPARPRQPDRGRAGRPRAVHRPVRRRHRPTDVEGGGVLAPARPRPRHRHAAGLRRGRGPRPLGRRVRLDHRDARRCRPRPHRPGLRVRDRRAQRRSRPAATPPQRRERAERRPRPTGRGDPDQRRRQPVHRRARRHRDRRPRARRRPRPRRRRCRC